MDFLDLSNAALISAGATIVLGSALIYVVFSSGGDEESNSKISRISSYLSLGGASNTDEALEDDASPKAHINILYGSQTGTADSFSGQLSEQSPDHGYQSEVIDVSDLNHENIFQKLKTINGDSVQDNNTDPYYVMLLVSTYGEGEPPDTVIDFHKLCLQKLGLKKGEDSNEEGDLKDLTYFKNMNFCVFGLGNTEYEHYNSMGKFFDEHFEVLGGKRVKEIGLGDDGDDIEGDYEKWTDELWSALEECMSVGGDEDEDELVAICGAGGIDNTNDIIEGMGGCGGDVDEEKKEEKKETMPPCPYIIQNVKDDTANITLDDVNADDAHGVSKHYFTSVDCPISAHNEMITGSNPSSSSNNNSSPAPSTLHMEFDLLGTNVSYKTADNLGIFACNNESVINAIAKACNFKLDTYFRVLNAKNKNIIPLFPTPCTIHECLQRYCDVTSPPRRSVLKQLSFYCTDPIDANVLRRLSSKEGKEEYREKILDQHVGLVDIITRLCPSICLPLHRFLQIVPRMQPRYYTISSSPQVVSPTVVSITMSVLRYLRNDSTVFEGLCSNYLNQAGIDNSKVRLFNRESTFRLPSDPSKPILMIGPGTGIAPMRALLQERDYQKHTLNLPVGRNILYFGCKYQSYDQLYQDEFQALVNKGLLTKYYNAFSRGQQQKIYVQHLLLQNKTETWDCISNGCSIYVCGASAMGKDVLETLRNIVKEMGNMSADGAKKYLDGMHNEGRFVQELWA